MKRLILLTAMMLMAISVMAQTQHYTLEQCDNDILKYIEKNYEDNGARYKDKSFATFIDECELPLTNFVPSIFYRGEGPDVNNGKIRGIRFYIYKDNYKYSIPIWFKSYIYSIDDYDLISSKTHTDVWGQEFYDFFKGYTIERVGKVLKERDGKYIDNYRRP